MRKQWDSMRLYSYQAWPGEPAAGPSLVLSPPLDLPIYLLIPRRPARQPSFLCLRGSAWAFRLCTLPVTFSLP